MKEGIERDGRDKRQVSCGNDSNRHSFRILCKYKHIWVEISNMKGIAFQLKKKNEVSKRAGVNIQE